jgi:DNA-binding GntR family transcriptional regulator
MALRRARSERQRASYVERNREFHMALYSPCMRPQLLALIESLHKKGERYLRLKLEMPVRKRKSDDEHARIYDACRRDDQVQAVEILTSHLLETGAMLARFLSP